MATKKKAGKTDASKQTSRAHTAAREAARVAARAAPARQVRPQEMEALRALLKRNGKRLRALKGVRKVDVGFRWQDGRMTGEVALRVHVRKKKPIEEVAPEDLVPDEIDGFPVDVIVSNAGHQQARPERRRLTRRNPLMGGVEIRNVDKDGAGTLGAIVFDRSTGAPMALSNHHVFSKNRPEEGIGETVNQPATTRSSDAIGSVTRGNRRLDCAVAALREGRRFSVGILDFPGGIKGVADPLLGMRVAKSGRTTGTTFGVIEGVTETEFTVVPTIDDGKELTSGGDSGSVWLEETSHAAVGLHSRGEPPTAAQERATVKWISKVSASLDIDLHRVAALAQTSSQGPALAAMDHRLLVAWVGAGLRLHFAGSADGLRFSDPVELPDQSPAAPALTVFRGKFVAAWIGVGNNNLNISQSDDGVTWSGTEVLAEISPSSPALAVFRRRLYIAWRGPEGRLHVMRSSDGRTWRDKRVLGDTTASGPTLAARGFHLVLAWRELGTDQLKVRRSRFGTTFGASSPVEAMTTARPCLREHDGRLYLAWQGVGDQRLNVLDSRDGKRWEHPLTLRDTCTAGPALGSLDDSLVWCWAEGGAEGRLRTMVYDLKD